MTQIISLLHTTTDKQAAFEVARKLGACMLDTREVIRMLHFITNQGRLVKGNEGHSGWRLVHADNPEKMGFRMRFIQDLIKLLDLLHEQNGFSKAEELAERLNFEYTEVSQALIFLETITNQGRLDYEDIGSKRCWYLRGWP